MTARRDHPAVTIAVPSFNQGRYLGAALESALAQDVAGRGLRGRRRLGVTTPSR